MEDLKTTDINLNFYMIDRQMIVHQTYMVSNTIYYLLSHSLYIKILLQLTAYLLFVVIIFPLSKILTMNQIF